MIKSGGIYDYNNHLCGHDDNNCGDSSHEDDSENDDCVDDVSNCDDADDICDGYIWLLYICIVKATLFLILITMVIMIVMMLMLIVMAIMFVITVMMMVIGRYSYGGICDDCGNDICDSSIDIYDYYTNVCFNVSWDDDNCDDDNCDDDNCNDDNCDDDNCNDDNCNDDNCDDDVYDNSSGDHDKFVRLRWWLKIQYSIF